MKRDVGHWVTAGYAISVSYACSHDIVIATIAVDASTTILSRLSTSTCATVI